MKGSEGNKEEKKKKWKNEMGEKKRKKKNWVEAREREKEERGRGWKENGEGI